MPARRALRRITPSLLMMTALLAIYGGPALGQSDPLPNFSDPYYRTCTTMTTFPFGVATGDLLAGNGPDVVVTNGAVNISSGLCAGDGPEFPGTISIFENQGPLAWQQNPQSGLVLVQEIVVCGDCSPAEVALVDMDGNSALDIYVSAADRDPANEGVGDAWGVYVLRQISFGNFDPPIYLPTPGPVRSMAVRDLDNNGFPDVAAVGDACYDSGVVENDKLWIWWTDAGGEFTLMHEYDLGISSNNDVGLDILAVDFDNSPPSQSKPDLIVPGDAQTFVRWYRNLGNKQFEARSMARPGGSCPNSWEFFGVAAGKFDGGLGAQFTDLAFCRNAGPVDILLGNNAAGFTHDCDLQVDCNSANGDHYELDPGIWCTGGGPPVTQSLGDIQAGKINANNSRVDLATTNLFGNTIGIMLGRLCPTGGQTGKFRYNESEEFFICLNPTGQHGNVAYRLALEDMDGNDLDDVVTVFHEANVSSEHEMVVILSQ